MSTDKGGTGLRGVSAGRTAISTVGKEGLGLTYRGYDIAELAVKSTFIETAYLLIYGDLPTAAELQAFSSLLTQTQMLHEDLKFHFDAFPPSPALRPRR